MSVALELSRIQDDRNKIRAKLVELGLATSNDNLDALVVAIEKIIKKQAISVEIKEGDSYTIPAGYHDGGGTVKAVSGGGNYKLQSKNITPTKNKQIVTSDEGYYGLDTVTVEGIPLNYQDVSSVTATTDDVLTGKVYVTKEGKVVTGTMLNNGSINKTIDVISLTYTIPKGYHDGTGTVKVVLETKTIVPSKKTQTITPTAGKVLSSVKVGPIPEAYQDVTQVDATAQEVLVGKKIVNATGEIVEGGMPNNKDTSATIDGLTITSVDVPAGYTTGGVISLTGDIEEQLSAI